MTVKFGLKNSKNLKYYLKKRASTVELACEDEENDVYWSKSLT